MWVCLKMSCTPVNPMVLLIIILMKNGYFIGNINPTFSDKPMSRTNGYIYPLLQKITIFNGKIHYFYGHFPLQTVNVHQVGYFQKLSDCSSNWGRWSKIVSLPILPRRSRRFSWNRVVKFNGLDEGKIGTGKPHIKNGKIYGFRLKLSLKPIQWKTDHRKSYWWHMITIH